MAKENKSSSTDAIYAQIERAAALYGPEVYELLTFASTLKTQSDSEASNFIPITNAKQTDNKNYKMFVVGLLPPSVEVTGRLLDRSSSVARFQGFSEPVDTETGNVRSAVGATGPGSFTAPWVGPKTGPFRIGPIVTAPGYKIESGEGSSNLGVTYKTSGVGDEEDSPVITNLTYKQVYQAMHDAYVSIYKREPTPVECLIYAAHSLTETDGKWPNNNPGFIGNYTEKNIPKGVSTFVADGPPGSPSGSTGRYFNTYNTVEEGARNFLYNVAKGNSLTAAREGDVLGYSSSLAQRGYFGEPTSQYYKGLITRLKWLAPAINGTNGLRFGSMNLPDAPNVCGFTETQAQYQKRNQISSSTGTNAAGDPFRRFNDEATYGDKCSLGPSGNADTGVPETSWQKTGAKNAQQAKKAEDKLAGTNLNQTELGKQLSAQQRAVIKALHKALDQMKKTPPLKLLVNPVSFKVAREKVIADGNRSRQQHIVEHFGETQMKIDASGKLAAFMAIDAKTGQGPGLTRSARNYSASYQNFMSLYLIYKNNGGIWLQDFADQSNGKPNNLAMLGSVYIYYDDTLYIGSFDTFSITEGEDNPYSLEYSFAFSVRSHFLLDRANDQSLTYGAPNSYPQAQGKSIKSTSEEVVGVTETVVMTPKEQENFKNQLLNGTLPSQIAESKHDRRVGSGTTAAPEPSSGSTIIAKPGTKAQKTVGS